MFKFWFKFISGEQDQIALRRTKGVLEAIMQELPRYLGPVFERQVLNGCGKERNCHLIHVRLKIGGDIILF